MSFDVLSVPALNDIPASYTIGVGRTFARDLTLSLLDGNVITEADLVKRPKNELELATRALTRRWDHITEGMRYFDWRLRIEATPEGCYPSMAAESDTVWAAIQTEHGPVSCPQMFIGYALEALEQVREGLGQTVLATLYDAFRMLPQAATPACIFGLASYCYWYGEADETEALAEMMSMHDVKTLEDLLTVTDVFTRKTFFEGMPEWAVFPRRKLTRNQVRRAAARNDYAREVVEAMDALWNVVTFYGPFADVRCDDVGADLIDYSLLLRWHPDDQLGRVMDDFLHSTSDGEYVIASCVTPLKVTGSDFSRWLKEMEATALLAKCVERVLTLFEERDRRLARIMVRV
ncbi:PRTRC system protein F [Paraburkholderia sp. GAS82]|uniref:PRTRC system protein F n=1 Tax=Paraburkholderia sp. GAS82 TaxID=3035137 RepID=UPI003D24AE33